jgi:nitrile hydratase
MSEPHDHRHGRDDEDSVSYYRTMEIAVRSLLIEKGIFSAQDVRRTVEAMDGRNYSRGARVVAHAWQDGAYRARLLANGTAAVEELGMQVGPLKLVVVENTPAVHNVVVCTLCSCYPRMLLGLPPDWYKSREYRSRVVREPRAVLADFGTALPADVTIRVHDSTADMRYMVLPMRPPASAGESAAQLERRISRDALVGTAVIDR